MELHTFPDPHPQQISCVRIFLIFLRLGLVSFGGPIAHLGYFRQEFVDKRKWLDDAAYTDLVALCQFLPGPASSQVGMALGLSRGGVAGAAAAWLGFVLPSALLLVLFGLGFPFLKSRLGTGWLHGLNVVAVAVVAQALWGMGKPLHSDRVRLTLAAGAVIAAVVVPSVLGQMGILLGSGLFGWVFLRNHAGWPQQTLSVPIPRWLGGLSLSLFVLLLVALPLVVVPSTPHAVTLFASFYRAGSLVFGGGHVVLPLLQAQVVPTGWVSNDVFLAGYGAAQAVPGPLFTFAAYLGAVSRQLPAGVWGAGIALVAIFLPSFLLVVGIFPFWEQLRRYRAMQCVLLGLNAAVIGILLAAWYNPIWTHAIYNPVDFCLAVGAFLLLVVWKCPSWLVVLLAVVVTGLLQWVS